MQGDVGTARRGMLTRRCVACGRGVVPLDLLEDACPDCGCDFDDRPPMTYAEMEGFEPVAEWIAIPMAPPAASPGPGRAGLRYRWAIFGVVMAAGLLAVIMLLAAATA